MGDKGEQLGVMPLYQAREIAKTNGLDIVEVAPTSVPPVCRLMDYGKYKYQQTKKEREARKGQKISALREIRVRPKIGDHDFEAKARTAQKLLISGDKVKVSVLFRGRENTHPELGWKLLQRMIELQKEVAAPERQPVMEGRRMEIILIPIPPKPKPKEDVKETQNAQNQNA
jgi:translation initiation factor IF-3